MERCTKLRGECHDGRCYDDTPHACHDVNCTTERLRKQLADAQATVEALQARVRELEESRDAWRASQECSEKAYMALVNQIPAERFDYDPVNVALLDGAKEQEIIGRKQIADLQAALDAEREKVADLEYEMHRKWESDTFCDEKAGGQLAHKPYVPLAKRLEDQLSQLQALVRALPVVRIDLNGAYHDTLLARPEDDAVKELLRYRASLDATTPAVCQDCDGDGAVDSGGTDPNGNPLMRRCGCREKGGDGE